MFKIVILISIYLSSVSVFAQSKKPFERPEVLAKKCTPKVHNKLQSFLAEKLVDIEMKRRSSGLTEDGLFKGEIKPYSIVFVECDQITLNSYSQNGDIYYSLNFLFVDSDFVLTVDGEEVKDRFHGTVNLELGTYNRTSIK